MTDHHALHSHGPDLARLLDLDAMVNAPLLEEALAIVAELAGSAEAGPGAPAPEGAPAPAGAPRRILDIGAGTGTGAIALARRFPAAEVVAVDIDDRMLGRVRERAETEGLADRITTVRSDVAAADTKLGTADVIWSSAALHEVSDAPRALKNLFEALRPNGLIVVVEMDAPPRLLPAAYAGLENRMRAEAAHSRAFDHPDWSAGLVAAGFDLALTRTLATDRRMPADGPAGEYAVTELRRVAHTSIPALDEADRATLAELTGDEPGSVRTLGELSIQSTRTLWAARRP